MGRKYWEMWYITWKNRQFVFMPNYMPKKYAIAIVPMSGFLICMAAVASIVDDTFKLRVGTYKPSKQLDSDIDEST